MLGTVSSEASDAMGTGSPVEWGGASRTPGHVELYGKNCANAHEKMAGEQKLSKLPASRPWRTALDSVFWVIQAYAAPFSDDSVAGEDFRLATLDGSVTIKQV